MDLFVVVDNRSLSRSGGFASFEQEAGEATVRQLSSLLLAHYLQTTQQHVWTPWPKALLVAGSPSTTKLVLGSALRRQDLETHLTARFSASGNTWALNSIREVVGKQPASQSTSLVVLIMTNDLSARTFPSHETPSNVSHFLTRANLLKTSVASLRIIVLCPIVSSVPQSTLLKYSCEDSVEIQSIRRCLQGEEALMELRPFPNTGMHFEDELRYLIEIFSTRMVAAIHIPACGGSKLADLKVELSAYSKSSEDSLHPGLATPSLHSIASRNAVDPLHLKGQAIVVRALSTANKVNEKVFRALAKHLASQNVMLILKVPYKRIHSQYWALIPPAEESGEREAAAAHMVLLRLVEKEDVLRPILAANMEDDEDDVLEFASYIGQALKSLGPVGCYNPMACSGGLFREDKFSSDEPQPSRAVIDSTSRPSVSTATTVKRSGAAASLKPAQTASKQTKDKPIQFHTARAPPKQQMHSSSERRMELDESLDDAIDDDDFIM